MGGECPCFLAACHCLKYACVVDLSLQARSIVTLEDVAVLGECCPSGHDSFLNLLVLVFVSDAVSLSQEDVKLGMFNYCLIRVCEHLSWCLSVDLGDVV